LSLPYRIHNEPELICVIICELQYLWNLTYFQLFLGFSNAPYEGVTIVSKMGLLKKIDKPMVRPKNWNK
jgi:hypothetical protein